MMSNKLKNQILSYKVETGEKIGKVDKINKSEDRYRANQHWQDQKLK